MFPLKYIRTDKNGTRIYHDWNCPRCAGAGFCDKWINTGRVCYECGGSGKRRVAKVVKEYTPEYLAKLQARREAKAKKEAEKAAQYAAEHPEEIEAERKRQEEANRRALEFRFAEHGCGRDGIGYVLMGKTYPVKDKIRARGGKWLCGVWVCPEKIEAEGVQAVRIDISGCFGTHENDEPYASDIIWDARE